MRWRTVAVLGALAAVGAGSCTQQALKPLPPAPKVPSTTTTTVADTSGIALKGVPGRTTTTVVMGPGQATVSGSVSGPEGAVGGAVVRIERLAGDGTASQDVVTQPDGTWVLPTILGGRYRVRAWRAPDLALTTPQVFFLEGTESKVLQLQLTSYLGLAVVSAIAPNPPILDEPAGLTVQVVDRVVDDQGVVQAKVAPVVKVELTGSSDWKLSTANPVTSDEEGQVRWQLTCRRVGNSQLAVILNDAGTLPLDLPPCTAAPPPTEPPSSTSTTAAGH